LDRKRGGFAKLPRVLREDLMQPLGRSLPHGAWGRNYLHNVTLEPFDRYIEDISIFTRLNKPFLYTENFRSQLGAATPATGFVEIAARSRTDGGLDPLLYLDSKTYLPGDILTKVDRMSMAASLEARVPLLDHTLVEFVCRRISARMKLKGLTTKYILKQAVRDLVPSEILNRPKQGFGVPIDQWINQELRARVRETLTEPRSMQRGYIEPRYVSVLLNEHERGRRDHATQLWALFVLELWSRLFIDRPAAESVRDLTPSLASGSRA
jgi:asparagine synthase (glutamine-hydrolysing)